MIKRQRIIIIVLAAVFALLIAAYFIVIRPLTREDEPADTSVNVDPGEGVYANRPLMYPMIDRDDMQSVEVINENGTYKLVYDDKIGDFVIDGYEALTVNPLMFTQLVVDTGFSNILGTVSDNATEDELVQYGFKGDDAHTAKFVVTQRNGIVHTVTVGARVISGGGFYAMYEGRNKIYIISSTIEKTVFGKIEDMLSPVVSTGIPLTSYYNIEDFTIKHYGEDFIKCRNLSSDEITELESTAQAKAVTVYPAQYMLSMDYDTTLQLLIDYSGESVVAIGLTEENFEKFGLTDEPYSISYEYDGYKFKLTASEPVDGYYYVATSMFDIIVKVPEADFEFLTWDLKHWIDPLIFSRSITVINSIKIESEALTETFRLTHRPKDDPDLIVVGDECGQIHDIPNFREFYKTLLYVQLYDYAPEDVNVTEDDCVLKFTISTANGTVNEYSFYQYSTRRCLLRINGEGQFYVFIDIPEKIISDAQKVINGEPVDALDKD